MLFTRKIGSVLRGKATRGQVLLATTLGGLLGFVPGFFLPKDISGGFAQAPGLILTLLGLALILNANFAVFGLTVLLGKLLSLLLLPVSFAIGRYLLDGPLQGVFRSLVNGKVTAWFGLEHYATTGGLVLGLVFGLLAGLLLNRTIAAIRRYMAGVEERSERYQKYASKWWVKLCTWLFLGGGKGKKTWKELDESNKFGLPIRIVGVLVAGVLVGGLLVFQQWFSTPLLTAGVRDGLAVANGATVDLDEARLELGTGTLHLKRLQIADAKNLDNNLLSADELVARIDTGELLRKRLVIDELRSTNASTGHARTVRGVAFPPKDPPPPPPPPPTGSKTIDDYMKDVEAWRGRLEQAQQWLDRLGLGKTPPSQRSPEEIQREVDEQLRLQGYAKVVAEHLLEGAPRVLVRKIDIEGIGLPFFGDAEHVDLRIRNLSSDPSLLKDAASLLVASASDRFKLAATAPGAGGDKLGLDLAFKRMPVDALFGQFKLAGAAPLRGGTIDLSTNGFLQHAAGAAPTMNLPLQVAVRDTTFALAGAKETKVPELLLPIGLSGGVTKPVISLDDKTLTDALVKAGQRELANFVQGKAGALLGNYVPGIDQVLDPNKTPAENLDAAKQAAEDAAKKAAAEAEAKARKEAEAAAEKAKQDALQKAADEAKKRLPGGIQLPGGRKN